MNNDFKNNKLNINESEKSKILFPNNISGMTCTGMLNKLANKKVLILDPKADGHVKFDMERLVSDKK